MDINNSKKGRIRILMIGPLPVVGGGASVLFKQLVEELRNYEDVSLSIIDTGRQKGNSFSQKIRLFFRTTVGMLREARKADVISFHASPDGTVFFGPVAYAISKMFRRPIIMRQFGGVLDVRYSSGSIVARKAISIVLKSERVLLETRRLTDYFAERFPKACLEWYPNSRKQKKQNQSRRMMNKGSFKFIFLGHVKRTKGIYEILEAAHLLSTYQFSVDVFGPLRDGCREDIFAGNPNVKYCGSLNPDDAVEMLSKYDVLLLPTYHSGEGYPGVIIEAYMAGIPVIATRWISIPEIVEDGVSGILIPPKDARALADAMKIIMTDMTKYNEMKRGLVKYEKLFISERWTKRFLEICREVNH